MNDEERERLVTLVQRALSSDISPDEWLEICPVVRNAIRGVGRYRMRVADSVKATEVRRLVRKQIAGAIEHDLENGDLVMGEILNDALTAARDEDERWMRESDGGTKFPMRAAGEIAGLGDFVPGADKP